ncbi:hypothetical protein BGZ75_001148 [Mortierella antarctica]|nr:hypothetical protein BGZ75_001148 [Mortierella antarctica]
MCRASGTPTGSATLPGPTGPLPSTKPSDPPAHLSMLEPKADIKNPPLFPLGKDIVFAWTITDIQNLIMKPTNLTIEAYLSDKIIVTIASGLPGNTMNYTWPAENQKNATNPIQTKEIYTIRIFDGQVGRYGRIAGGYLETYTSLKIGLYQPGAYTPGKDLFPPVCATCDFSKITNG